MLADRSRCTIATNSYCIAVPSSSGSALDWKSPSECVWDDQEFSQNGLQIRSKIAIRHIVEQHTPTTKAFFTDILKLSDAGICELLRDLELMQEHDCDEPARVYRLYERIQSFHRGSSKMIRSVQSRVQSRKIANLATEKHSTINH